MCPTWLCAVLPQLYWISRFREGIVCRECVRRFAEEELPFLQLRRSCHPCWIRFVTATSALGVTHSPGSKPSLLPFK
ncbi:mCG147603 [Mus musculus]|nr:mCG147603 [Mus musculus]